MFTIYLKKKGNIIVHKIPHPAPFFEQWFQDKKGFYKDLYELSAVNIGESVAIYTFKHKRRLK